MTNAIHARQKSGRYREPLDPDAIRPALQELRERLSRPGFRRSATPDRLIRQEPEWKRLTDLIDVAAWIMREQSSAAKEQPKEAARKSGSTPAETREDVWRYVRAEKSGVLERIAKRIPAEAKAGEEKMAAKIHTLLDALEDGGFSEEDLDFILVLVTSLHRRHPAALLARLHSRGEPDPQKTDDKGRHATDLAQAIRAISLALNACHNTVATDDVRAEPKEDYSWRIDNLDAIGRLQWIEELLRQHGYLSRT